MTESQSDYIQTNDVAAFLAEEGVTMRSRNSKMVGEFRRAMDLPIGVIPDSTKADLDLHSDLLMEESIEFVKAAASNDPHEILDALADVVYIAYGAALDCGYDLDAALTRVHTANMAKMGPEGKPVRNAVGKVMKPGGWLPPDLSDLVERTV